MGNDFLEELAGLKSTTSAKVITDPLFHSILKDYANDRAALSSSLLNWARTLEIEDLVPLSPAILTHLTPRDIVEYHEILLRRNNAGERLLGKLKTLRISIKDELPQSIDDMQTNPNIATQDIPSKDRDAIADMMVSAVLILLASAAFLAARALGGTFGQAIMAASFLPFLHLILLAGLSLPVDSVGLFRRASLHNLFAGAVISVFAWTEYRSDGWAALVVLGSAVAGAAVVAPLGKRRKRHGEDQTAS